MQSAQAGLSSKMNKKLENFAVAIAISGMLVSSLSVDITILSAIFHFGLKNEAAGKIFAVSALTALISFAAVVAGGLSLRFANQNRQIAR